MKATIFILSFLMNVSQEAPQETSKRDGVPQVSSIKLAERLQRSSLTVHSPRSQSPRERRIHQEAKRDLLELTDCGPQPAQSNNTVGN